MAPGSDHILKFFLVLLLSLQLLQSSAQAHHQRIEEMNVKSEVFRSPKFALEPGLASNKAFFNIDFPRGHIGIKSFDAELVDEDGNPIPLHETYLHHWLVFRYYQRRGVSDIINPSQSSDRIFVNNSGVSERGLTHYFGSGAETRRTPTDIPDPFGVEVGDGADVPEGYEEQWMLNVHVIDTRGAEDRMGCAECRCDLYGVVLKGYKGGLKCCESGSRCRVKEGFHGARRDLYMRYRVRYVEWRGSIVPVKIYSLDVTDLWTEEDESRGVQRRHPCLIEYDVESCSSSNVEADDRNYCTHTRTLHLSSPINGDLVYAVGHLHVGGFGIALYGQGGREICASAPIYGEGTEAGNEAGYVVGMSTCYPPPGSVMIAYGETLTLISNYSSAREHTGVMGLFYLLVADKSSAYSNSIVPDNGSQFPEHESVVSLAFNGTAVVLFGLALVVVVIFKLWSYERRDSYEPV